MLNLGSELATVPNGTCTTHVEGICPGTGSAEARSYAAARPTPPADIATARGAGLARAAQQTALLVKILFSCKSTVLIWAGLADDISGVFAEVPVLTNLFSAIQATTQLC